MKKIISLLLLSLTLYANQLQKVSLQLHWKNQFEFAGYYMAKEKGFYKDVGLEVKLKEYQYGINVVDEVISGRATYAIGGSDLIINISNGSKIKLLTSIFQSSPLILLTTKKSGIKSLKDFKGKKIMLTPDVISSVTFNAMMRKEDISLKNLIPQKHSFDVNDLIDGRTDLLQSYITNEPYALKKQGITPVIFDPKDYGFNFYSDILFTSESVFSKDSKKVIAFKEASLKGWNYAFNHIDETVKIILEKYNTQNRTQEALLYEAKESKKLAYKKNIALGDISKEKLQRIYDAYNLMNFVNNTIDIKDSLITNSIPTKKNDTIQLTIKEKEFIKKHKQIVLGYSTLSQPIIINTKNSQIGFGVDLANIIYEKTGLEIIYQNGNWDHIIKDAKKKKLDGLVVTVSKAKPRSDYFNFTKEYMTQTPIILVKTGNIANIHNLKDLKHKKMAILKGVDAMEDAANAIGAKKIYYDNINQVIKAVVSNEVEFTVFFENIFYIADSLGLNYLEIAFPLGKPRDVFFSIRDDYPEVVSIINKVLDTLSLNDLTNIKNSWFTKKHNPNKLALNSEEIEYLIKKKTIKMCVDPNWMPVEGLNSNGIHEGIVADIFNLLTKNNGIKIDTVVTKNWDETIAYAKDRKCDILSLAVATKKRKEYMNFTTPYLNYPLVIATKNNENFINSIEEVIDKPLVAVKNYFFIEVLRKRYPNIKIQEVDNILDGLKLVQQNKAYGYIDILAPLTYTIQKEGFIDMRISGKFDDKWELSIASRNDEPILNQIFQKALNSITKEQITTITNKWSTINITKEKDYTLLYKVLLGMLIHSGLTVPILNLNTGEVEKAQIFVSVLGLSGYTFVHATPSQRVLPNN